MTGGFENSLIIMFTITMLWVAASSRLEVYTKMLSLQGILLFTAAVSRIPLSEPFTLGFITVETLGLKAVVIPWFLLKVIRENNIRRETEPYIPNLYSLIVAMVLTAVGFILAFIASSEHHPVNPCFFGAAVSVILIALFILLTRKKFITHIIAYIFLENGIFLLSLSVVEEMPFVVNLGVALDIFVWVLLAGAFIKILKSTVPGEHVDKLKGLRG